jgi:hypothetical protein
MEEQEITRLAYENMPKFDYRTIDDMINILQKVRKEHGNLSIINEYEASYWIGGTIRVNDTSLDPENYLGPTIKAVELI